MTHDVMLLVLAGGFAGGFVTGLAGFGTGLAALVFWLQVLPPVLAGPLVVVCSVVGQLQTLPKIWHAIEWQRVLPFILGGILGVPIGTLLLTQIDVRVFKFGVGILLIIYCSWMLLGNSRLTSNLGGRRADALIGLGGGILGGLAGLSGPLPTIWASLKNWDKDQRRGVFQAFNLSILTLALISQAIGGLVTWELVRVAMIALIGTISGAWLGRRLYARLGNEQFHRVVLIILLLSGIMLTVSA